MTEKLNLHNKTSVLLPQGFAILFSIKYIFKNFSIGSQNFESVEKNCEKFLQFFFQSVKSNFLLHKSTPLLSWEKGQKNLPRNSPI